jgi:succinate dehydrogenase/fumarate reductase flavoprotein subunit
MDPREIFQLLIEADEKLKYAKPGVQDVRVEQARELVNKARDAAVEIGNGALVAQAEARLADLESISGA